MTTTTDTEHVTTAANDVDDAEGVSRRQWYVAIVNHNSEKAVHEKLSTLGYQSYVAKQMIDRVWKNGRKAKVDKVIIPSKVFIRCTEEERRYIVTFPFINRFLTNRAATINEGISRPLAVIPQSQIDMLRFMLGQSDIPVSFDTTPIQLNDKIKVIRGNLKGIEGEVISINAGKSEIIVRLGVLGAAKMSINAIDIERK